MAVRADLRRPPKTVLFVPCDPKNLIGSRGDEAMIGAAVAAMSASGPVRIVMITGSAHATALAQRLGLEPLPLWRREGFVVAAKDAIGHVRPDAVLVLGADVVDGCYSAETAMRLLIVADLAARARIPSIVLGFSFSSNAALPVRDVLDAIHPDVRLNLREEASLERFRAFTKASPRLVADVAFLLQPAAAGASHAAAAAWVAERRAAGRRVFGFNVHPMLVKDAPPKRLAGLVSACVDAVAAAHAERHTAWLLLPHDFRGQLGDNVCLAPAAQQLGARLGADVMHLAGEPGAAELKAIAGLLDGVVAGRMHLAIAALGMGIPVAALTYQDKFRGLFRHFDLPEDLLVAPEEIDQGNRLRAMVGRLVDQSETLRTRIQEKLPAVISLSKRNFEGLGL